MTEQHVDAQLLAEVRGLGEVHEPDEQARDRAASLDVGEEFDLRGSRDRDSAAPHPWRSS